MVKRLSTQQLRVVPRLLGPGGWCSVVATTVVMLTAAAGTRVRAQTAVLTSTAPAEAQSHDELTPTCKTDLRLSGAVYNEAHPERSFALLQVRPNRAGELYRAGMSIGGYQLVAIEPRGILLRNSAGDCWLRLVGDPAERARRAKIPPPVKVKARKRK